MGTRRRGSTGYLAGFVNLADERDNELPYTLYTLHSLHVVERREVCIPVGMLQTKLIANAYLCRCIAAFRPLSILFRLHMSKTISVASPAA